MDEKEQRAPYVEFRREPVEDREQSMADGVFRTKDVDYAILTPIGSKDRIPRKVDDWFIQLEQQIREGRIPPKWLTQYREAYNFWRRGEEIPDNGTPIKGWNLISPSAQTNIVAANIRTVEDLAQANDEARRRIGMGANEYVEKAKAWIKSMTDHARQASEMVGLRMKNSALEAEIQKLKEIVRGLEAQLGVIVK